MAAKGKPVEELKVADLEGFDGPVNITQEITEVTAAEARQAGEIVTDEGDAHEKIVAFLDQLKVI
jgi:electron transfer flavoprotein beta subunit